MGVSVVMATYNGGPFLAEQLMSILSQTVLPDEIVIADDGSTDDTERIIFRFRGKFPNLLYIPSEGTRLGPGKNFERAIKRSSQEFIVFSDQDDIWQPDRIEIQQSALKSNPGAVLLHSNARLVDQDGNMLGDLFSALGITKTILTRINNGEAFNILLRRNVVTGATVMTRREFALSTLPFPDAWLHDEWLAICGGNRVRVLDHCLIQYRQHDKNHIGARRLSVREKFLKLFEDTDVRNARLLARTEALTNFAEEKSGNIFFNTREIGLIRKKLTHERFRSTLGKSRLLRIWPVLKRVSRYRQFSNFSADILRDLLSNRQHDKP